eukprot:10597625-Lingulodinium_polyedra.AAC.1
MGTALGRATPPAPGGRHWSGNARQRPRPRPFHGPANEEPPGPTPAPGPGPHSGLRACKDPCPTGPGVARRWPASS